MKVEAKIERKDLFKMQLYLLPRLKVNLFAYIFLFACAGFGGYGLIESKGIVCWILCSFIISTLVFITFYFFGVLFQILTASAEKGFIGEQVFEIQDTVFFEKTMGTETKTTWSSVEKIYKSRNYIFVRINGFRIHIIPKRAFSNPDEFDSFGITLFDKVSSA